MILRVWLNLGCRMGLVVLVRFFPLWRPLVGFITFNLCSLCFWYGSVLDCLDDVFTLSVVFFTFLGFSCWWEACYFFGVLWYFCWLFLCRVLWGGDDVLLFGLDDTMI